MTVITLSERYKKGTISEAMLKMYVKKGVITSKDYRDITGKDINA